MPPRLPTIERSPERRAASVALGLVLAIAASWVVGAAPAGAAPECTVTGTDGSDRLHGTPEHDVICGLGGNDVLSGGAGDDVLLGGTGIDTATYVAAQNPVVVNLATGNAGGAGADHLQGIENVIGSGLGDAITGDGRDNVLVGGEGADTIDGGAGEDLLVGGGGDDGLVGRLGRDYLAGGPDADDLVGGDGTDACDPGTGAGSTASCLGPTVPDSHEHRGPLDIATVEHLGTSEWWRVSTVEAFSAPQMLDRGFVIVFLDTRFDGRPDYHAIVRSGGHGFSATLFRDVNGREIAMGDVPVWRPDGRTVAVRVPSELLVYGPTRTMYHWRVQTLYTGPGCGRVCFDLLPNQDDVPGPRPGLL